ADDTARLQGGETFTQRIKLQESLAHCPSTELAGTFQPLDSGAQPSERAFLSTPEFAGNLSGHVGPQKTNGEQSRVVEGEVSKHDQSSLDQIAGRVGSCGPGIQPIAQ